MKNILFVENKYYVTCNEFGIKFVNTIDKSNIIYPFDDVEWLIFRNKNSYFSNRLIQNCLEQNIDLIFCDNKMTPVSILVSESRHKERLTRLTEQIKLSSRTKNRLWRKVVISKILNQARVIQNIYGDCEAYDLLIKISKDIVEGDNNIKRSFYTILLNTCVIDNKVMTLNGSIEIMINSLIKCISKDNSSNLILPKIKEFGE